MHIPGKVKLYGAVSVKAKDLGVDNGPEGAPAVITVVPFIFKVPYLGVAGFMKNPPCPPSPKNCLPFIVDNVLIPVTMQAPLIVLQLETVDELDGQFVGDVNDGLEVSAHETANV